MCWHDEPMTPVHLRELRDTLHANAAVHRLLHCLPVDEPIYVWVPYTVIPEGPERDQFADVLATQHVVLRRPE